MRLAVAPDGELYALEDDAGSVTFDINRAEPDSPSPRRELDPKAEAARYARDLRMCREEARLQDRIARLNAQLNRVTAKIEAQQRGDAEAIRAEWDAWKDHKERPRPPFGQNEVPRRWNELRAAARTTKGD